MPLDIGPLGDPEKWAILVKSSSPVHNERYAVERTNALMDSLRSLLNRFDTTIESWKGFNYLSFMVLSLKKFKSKKFK